MREFMKKHKADICLLTCLMIIGMGFGIYTILRGNSGNQILVSVDGKVIKTFSQDETITYTIEGKDGKNILKIDGGKAWLLEADCPDQICVKTGKIMYPGQSIICLPHRVAIEIKEIE